MGESVRGWWTAGEAGAVAVYRAHLMWPLLSLSAVCLVLYWRLPDSSQHLWFFVCWWIALALPLVIRRRRAAIFTSDELILRPVFGAWFRIPLSGVRHAEWFKYGRQIRLRLDLFVGGRIEMPFQVRGQDQILKRLRAATLDQPFQGDTLH